jgi:transposase
VKERTKPIALIEPYKVYLYERWVADQPKIADLHRELRAKSYTGSTGPIRAFLARLRPQPYWSAMRTKVPRKLAPEQIPLLKTNTKLSSRQTSWLLFKRDSGDEVLNDAQRGFLSQLQTKTGEVAVLYQLVQEFRQLVSNRTGGELDGWLASARASGIRELVSFSNGIERDLDAVTAGLTLEHSNGQLEAQINRVKNLKRQMYGRAGFKLLRIRILADACKAS